MHDLPDPEAAVLEGFRWCRGAQATVSWGRDFEEPVCSVEVRAPDWSLEILRGCGLTFVEAYRACREKYDARRLAPKAVERTRGTLTPTDFVARAHAALAHSEGDAADGQQERQRDRAAHAALRHQRGEVTVVARLLASLAQEACNEAERSAWLELADATVR